MRHFILSAIHAHKTATQRLFHMLAILLVLVSNFGPLATPARAKVVLPVEKKAPAKTSDYAPPRFSYPAPRKAHLNDETATPTLTPTPSAQIILGNYILDNTGI